MPTATVFPSGSGTRFSVRVTNDCLTPSRQAKAGPFRAYACRLGLKYLWCTDLSFPQLQDWHFSTRKTEIGTAHLPETLRLKAKFRFGPTESVIFVSEKSYSPCRFKALSRAYQIRAYVSTFHFGHTFTETAPGRC